MDAFDADVLSYAAVAGHPLGSVHLATAVAAGADRFITNNQRDFPRTITELAVTYPADLGDPGP